MHIVLIEQPPIPKEVNNPETLAYFIARSLGLIPERGKGDVVLELLLLFSRIAGIKEGLLEEKGQTFPIKNGAMKARDILSYLRLRGHSISQSQFYVTYLARFLERGLIVKKKGSMYGLRAPSLVATLEDLFLDVRRLWERLVNHAQRLEEATR